MSKLLPEWVWIALLVVAWGGCGFYLGSEHANTSWLAKQGKQERAAREQLQAAQAKGDALSQKLLLLTGEIDQLKEEAHHAITTATTGRTCLDSAALRVLQRAPGITVVPQATSSPAAAGDAPGSAAGDSAAAIDSSISTDTQVATWAVDAGAAFEVCRTRLDALIDWYTAP